MKNSLIAFILIISLLCFTSCSTTSSKDVSSTRSSMNSAKTNSNAQSFTPVYSTEDYFDTLEYFDKITQKTIKYLFHEPLRQSDEPMPLVIFLHGKGDSVTAASPGTATPIVQSLMKLENENPDYSTYTLVPSTPLAHQGDWTDSQVAAFKSLLKNTLNFYNIDKERIYLSGISMGGFMTCRLVSEMPRTFAAAVPLSGAQNLLTFSASYSTAFRIYHVATDTVVNVSCSRMLYQQLQHLKHPNVEYTEYPDGSHISPIYTVFESDREEFFGWLFRQRLKNAYN